MFITLVITMIVLAVLCYFLMQYGDNYWAPFSALSTLVGVASGVGSFVIAIFLGLATWGWYAAEHQAKIINREYNTQYTQEEIFYASDVIETIREIQRSRKEITLNVNTEKK